MRMGASLSAMFASKTKKEHERNSPKGNDYTVTSENHLHDQSFSEANVTALNASEQAGE